MNKHTLFKCLPVLLFAWCILDADMVFAQKAKRKGKENIENNVQKQRNLSQAEYYFAEGMKFYVLENYPKAIDQFQKALESNPDNAGANYTMADAQAKAGNTSQAVSFAEKAIKLNDGNKYFYYLLASLYEKEKKYAQAVKVYQDLIKKLPEDPESYFNLANIYLYQEKYEDAIKLYDRIEKTIGVNEDVIRQKQQIYLKLNKTEDAIAESKKLIEAFPGEIKYTILLAEIYMSNGRSKDAVPLLEKIIQDGTEQAQARLILSDIYRSNGQTDKAEQELLAAFSSPDLEADTKVQILASYVKVLKDESSKKNALKLADLIIKTHPQEAKAYAIYGHLLESSKEKERARTMFLTSLQLDNSVFETWHQLITLDYELNQVDSLLKHSEQALELFPNQGVFWFFNGYGLLAKKNYEKAILSLEESKKLSSSNKQLLNDIQLLLGDSYNGLGDYIRSDAAYESVLAADPDNATVLNNYSYYLSLRKEKLDRAKQMAGRLIEKHPDNPTYLDTYAWILYMMEDYKQARKYLEKAAANAANGTILEHYGDVLYKLGETELALQQWMKAKKLGESSDLIDKKIAQKKLYE
jgi:tetratricopeptide (TPR) repeat protein